MMNLDILLKRVIDDAKSLGIPVSNNIDPKVYIDKNRYDRVAACYRYPFPEKYEIHLSYDALRANEVEIKNIIAHEVLHTCFLSMDHDFPWNIYIRKMNERLGYNIKVTYMWHQIIKK